MDLKGMRKAFDIQKGTRDYIQGEIDQLQKRLDKEKKALLRKEKALLFIEDAAINMQGELSGGLKDCVAAGLNSVFDIPYGFRADFNINRGRPECRLSFLKKGKLVDPMAFSGGGEVDIAAFAARIACLSMAKQYRKVLLLDEPFLRLKGIKENKRVIDLMNELSHRLGIQIIAVNDERAPREDIIAGADKVFWVSQKQAKSQIEILK